MSAANPTARPRALVPAAAESSDEGRPRRIRLAKALAATAAAQIPDMALPPKRRKSEGAKAKKHSPGSNRYKLPDNELAQLNALKRRLGILGFGVKRSELMRAGLMLLVAMNDAQLQKAVAAVAAACIEPVRRPQAASLEAAA